MHSTWIASLFKLEYGVDQVLHDVYSTWMGLIKGSETIANAVHGNSAAFGGTHPDLKTYSGLHYGMIRTGKLGQVTNQKVAMEVRKAGLSFADV